MHSILVLGASGFIGRHIVVRALNAGYQVSAIMRTNSTPDFWETLKKQFPDRLNIRTGLDLAYFDEVSSLITDIKPDAVVHAAAAGAKPGQQGASGVIRDNVLSTSALLDACKAQAISKVILFGSALSYGSSNKPHQEGEVLNPESDYGLAKMLCSNIATYFNHTGYDCIIELRLFNVYGSNDHPKRLIPYIIEQALTGQPIELTSGNQKRDFVFIEDVVDVVMEAVTGMIPSGVYNVATQNPVSVADVARLILSLTESTSHIVFGAVASRSDNHQCLSGRVDKLDILNTAPKTSLRDGLSQMLGLEAVS